MLYDTSNPVIARHAVEYLERLSSKGYNVEVKHVRKNRSKWQNAWFHAVVKEVSEFTGYETEEAKEILKRKGGLAYKKKGHTFLRSTKDLDKKEFGEFMEKLIRVCAQELDMIIPDPKHYK